MYVTIHISRTFQLWSSKKYFYGWGTTQHKEVYIWRNCSIRKVENHILEAWKQKAWCASQPGLGISLRSASDTDLLASFCFLWSYGDNLDSIVNGPIWVHDQNPFCETVCYSIIRTELSLGPVLFYNPQCALLSLIFFLLLIYCSPVILFHLIFSLFPFLMLSLFLISPQKTPYAILPPPAQQPTHSCFLVLASSYMGYWAFEPSQDLRSLLSLMPK